MIHVLDSKCTLATLHKDTVVLNEFMGNRVSETLRSTEVENLRSTEVEKWYHIESKKNIADLGTRTNAGVSDVAEESGWQRGPLWMRLQIEEWTVPQDTAEVAILTEVLLRKAVVVAACSLDNIYNLRPFIERSYTFVLRVTATVIAILRSKCLALSPACSTQSLSLMLANLDHLVPKLMKRASLMLFSELLKR